MSVHNYGCLLVSEDSGGRGAAGMQASELLHIFEDSARANGAATWRFGTTCETKLAAGA
jgi:hypothetical protein